jgi:hypothetical protein
MDRGKESVMGLSSANMFMSAALGLFGRAFIMGGIIYIAVQCFLLYRDGRYAQGGAVHRRWIDLLIAVIVIAVGVLCIWRS